MQAHWPEVDEVDLTLLKEAEYLTNVSHEFRVRLKKMVEMREKVRVQYDVASHTCFDGKGSFRKIANSKPPTGILKHSNN